MGFSTWSDTNWTVQLQKMAKGLKFWITEVEGFYYVAKTIIIIIIIIIISIFKEDNIFSITASLPYGPPVNTDIDYYRTFFRTCVLLQVLRG